MNNLHYNRRNDSSSWQMTYFVILSSFLFLKDKEWQQFIHSLFIINEPCHAKTCFFAYVNQLHGNTADEIRCVFDGFFLMIFDDNSKIIFVKSS